MYFTINDKTVNVEVVENENLNPRRYVEIGAYQLKAGELDPINYSVWNSEVWDSARVGLVNEVGNSWVFVSRLGQNQKGGIALLSSVNDFGSSLVMKDLDSQKSRVLIDMVRFAAANLKIETVARMVNDLQSFLSDTEIKVLDLETFSKNLAIFLLTHISKIELGESQVCSLSFSTDLLSETVLQSLDFRSFSEVVKGGRQNNLSEYYVHIYEAVISGNRVLSRYNLAGHFAEPFTMEITERWNVQSTYDCKLISDGERFAAAVGTILDSCNSSGDSRVDRESDNLSVEFLSLADLTTFPREFIDEMHRVLQKLRDKTLNSVAQDSDYQRLVYCIDGFQKGQDLFGLENGIIVHFDTSLGRYSVIEGNHRIMALKLLGVDKIPAIVRKRTYN